jgi:hypothetical protein
MKALLNELGIRNPFCGRRPGREFLPPAEIIGPDPGPMEGEMEEDADRDGNPHPRVNWIRNDPRVQSEDDLNSNHQKQARIENFERLNPAHRVVLLRILL